MVDAVVGHAAQRLAQHVLEVEAGEVRPDAAVHSETERGVRVREPVEHDLVGIRERLRVVVAHRVRQEHAVTGGELEPLDLAVLGDRATAALRGREVPQELLGREIEVARVVDQLRPLVGVRVEPVERAGEQRRGGVEAAADEQRDRADDAVVGEELVHHLGVEQRADHPGPRLGLADLHVLGEPPDHAHGRVDHAVPVGAVGRRVHLHVRGLAVDLPVGERQPEHRHGEHRGHDVGEVVDEVEASRLDDVVDARRG